MNSKKILMVKQAFAFLSFFMATQEVLAVESVVSVTEIPSPFETGSLCDVSARYGIDAFNEKQKSPDLSMVDFFTLTVYGLKKSEPFNKLTEKEQGVFVNFIWDSYSYVYDSDETNKEKIKEGLYNNCENKKRAAIDVLSQNVLRCQIEGRFYETLGMHRDNGQEKSAVKAVYASFLKTNPGKYQSISTGLDFVYADKDFKTASYLGKQVYESCLVK